MRTRRSSVCQGSALLEVFLAATIVAIGFVGVAGAFCYAAKVSRLAGDTMIAERLAAGLLAQARERGISQLNSWYTYPNEPNVTGLERDFSIALVQSGLVTPEAWFTVTDVSGGLKGVSVVIQWGVVPPKGRVVTQTLMSARF